MPPRILWIYVKTNMHQPNFSYFTSSEYVVLLGKNGGKTIRVLECGENGSPSRVLVDLKFNFDRTGFETLSVAKDFAFVEKKDGTTLFVMPSGTEHKVGIVNFSSGNFETTYVKFSDKEFDRGQAPHGRYRQVEWAVGTDYVWTNDSSNDEAYVIDVIHGKLVKTISDANSRFVSVQNWERVHQATMMRAELMKAMGSDIKVDGSSKSLSIAAILIGVLAVMLGAANLWMMSSMHRKMTSGKHASGIPKEVIDDTNDAEASLPSMK